MFQSIAPTVALILAVAVHGKSFTLSHAIGVGCVWLGLATFRFGALRRNRAHANRSAGTGNFPRGAPPGHRNPE
jgi:EamA domain-containing membrane protein RarD